MLHSRYLMPQRRFAGSEDRLERSAYTLLSRIDAQGPMSLGELSDALGLDVSTLNRQTAAMTKSGYVERVAGPRGRPGPQVPADPGRRRTARGGPAR